MELVYLDNVKKELKKIKTIDEAKEHRDKAEALRIYAKNSGASLEVQNNIAEYRIWCDRKMGEILIEQKETGERDAGKGGDRKSQSHDATVKLKDLGISKSQASRCQKIADIPEDELIEHIAGTKDKKKELTTSGLKKLTKEKKKKEKQERKNAVPEIKPDDRYKLICGEFHTAQTLSEHIDIIITDPPYSKKHLSLYQGLASVAVEVLGTGGSLVVMTGQSYLPDILSVMTPIIKYQWTLAYLTPGGQSVQLFQRNVNTFWKPVLWFVNGKYEGDWIGDVCKSDENDKRFHEWGQSESGMADLIERFTYPGETILDPFCGGGTTGIVAVKMNRKFIGIDKDEVAIETTRNRICEGS